MFLKICNYSILVFFLLCMVVIIIKPTEDHFYIEAGWNNPNCAAGPWAFCAKFYKLNVNHLQNSGIFYENTHNEVKAANNRYPFPCKNSKQPYCRRLGDNVLISIPFWNARNLTKIDIQGYQKCLVSNLSHDLYNKRNLRDKDYINNLSCKLLDSKKMTRYGKCAWKENKIMLVFKSPRKEISDLKNEKLKLKAFNKLEIDIEKCFKGFQNNKIYNFWPTTKIDFE